MGCLTSRDQEQLTGEQLIGKLTQQLDQIETDVQMKQSGKLVSLIMTESEAMKSENGPEEVRQSLNQCRDTFKALADKLADFQSENESVQQVLDEDHVGKTFRSE